MTVFSETYLQARNRFRDAATRAGARQRALAIGTSPEGVSLTCDIATLGDGPKALVVSSGIHGVEGFVGSAIEIDLLEHPPDGARLVLFHTLNPYGMCERRRVNESNVDLNRNFLSPGEAYVGSPDGHAIVSPLLNPETPYDGTDAFLLRAGLAIARHGFGPLKQATMEGQYDHPKALFYGGTTLERGPTLLLDAMRDALAGVETLVQLDVHTGLGKYGGATVLATEKLSKEALAETSGALETAVQPWHPEEGVAYAIRGGYGDAVVRLFPDARVRFFTIEIGTATPLRVIQALRTENQATHWGGDRDAARTKLLRTFYPDDESWRQRALAHGRRVIDGLSEMLRGP
jgi:hypothetical protein